MDAQFDIDIFTLLFQFMNYIKVIFCRNKVWLFHTLIYVMVDLTKV